VLSILLASTLPAQTGSDEPHGEAMVFQAFPEAGSCRRIVRDVDRKARTAIEHQLPFKVHFDELGPHTLFVAFRGRQPIGLLYLRSEEGEWGLTDIAWALSLDLRVLAFRFQRGRSRHLQDLEASAFASNLVGLDFAGVSGLITAPTDADRARVPPGAEQLATTVLRSCAKALLVIDTVWREEIQKLQDLGMGFDAFPTAEHFHRKVVQLDAPNCDPALAKIANVVRATSKHDLRLGAVVRTESAGSSDRLVLRWIVDADLQVVKIQPSGAWPDEALRIACKELEGHRLALPPAGARGLRPVARQLGEVLLRAETAGGGR
jgi:hypothetical protein